jgi:hypothetical protein
LKLDNNVLLREHFRGEFKAPSLLLSPLPLRQEQIAAGDPAEVWWNFLHPRSRKYGIEDLPIDRMRRHSFSLEEAFDEIDLKVAGAEIKGLLGVFKTVKRWFFKGFPAMQAFAGTSGDGEKASATIRLTCNYRRIWITRAFVSKRDQDDTISVFASTEEQQFADPVGLAAHRAAFKVFYRLADPSKHADEVTAIAAFHQAISLLFLLL